jgi:hypothetical protein
MPLFFSNLPRDADYNIILNLAANKKAYAIR